MILNTNQFQWFGVNSILEVVFSVYWTIKCLLSCHYLIIRISDLQSVLILERRGDDSNCRSDCITSNTTFGERNMAWPNIHSYLHHFIAISSLVRDQSSKDSTSRIFLSFWLINSRLMTTSKAWPRLPEVGYGSRKLHYIKLVDLARHESFILTSRFDAAVLRQVLHIVTTITLY